MALYTFAMPVGMDPMTVTPDRVAAYLTGKGYVLTNGASVNAVALTISIDCDRDPSADAAQFANAPTPKEQRVVTAKQAVALYVAAVAAIPVATRTPEQTLLLALIQLFGAQIGATS